ncbi:MAG: O-antigen ligase [Bacteriovoracaceae bacterium]
MELTKKYNFIFWGMIFLFLGLTSSPTLVSGYHILIFIPTLIIFKNGLRFKIQKSSWALIALVVWGLIATIYNNDTLIGPGKAYQELKYYLFGVFCIGTLRYFFKFSPKKHIKLLLNLLLFAIVVGFFVGIARSKFGFDPVKMMTVGDKYHTRVGGFTNYMRYGYSSALMLVLGLGAWINFSKVKEFVSKKWLITFIVFNLLAIIFSETRGAVLALVAGSSFMLIRYKPIIGKSLVGFGVLAVLSIGIISYTKSSSNRYFNINDGSNKIRMSQFYSAIKSIEEKPILGLGADQFSYNVKEIKKHHDIWAKNYSGHSHNILLEHGANYGIPGLIAFICFLLFWFIEMIKNKSDLSWVIASYIVAFTVGGQVELLFDVINSHLIFFLYSYSQVKLSSST